MRSDAVPSEVYDVASNLHDRSFRLGWWVGHIENAQLHITKGYNQPVSKRKGIMKAKLLSREIKG